YYNGENVTNLEERDFRPYRKKIQMIFQDPYASLNPRMKVGDIISEPLIIHNFDKSTREKKVKDLLEIVGLSGYHAKKYPHEFSGVQRQKICVSRAQIMTLELFIDDKIVSA